MNSEIVTNWSRRPPRAPWVTVAISVACVVLAVIYSSLSPLAQQAAIDLAGAVPARTGQLLSGPAGKWFGTAMLPVFSSLFVHSSWLHLAGNLAYLWVFGMPVERSVGHVFLTVLFLLGGALAHVIVAMQSPGLDSPIVGASGAVSVVVGAYLGLFPYRRIGLYLPLGLYFQFARVPALVVIGSWFTLQLVYTVFGPITGVVAWWTHLAGFVLGLVFAMLARALLFFRL